MFKKKSGIAIIGQALNGLVVTRKALQDGMKKCEAERKALVAREKEIYSQLTELESSSGMAEECISNINALLPASLK